MNDSIPTATLPPGILPPRSSAPEQEPRACFVGATMVDTTWGRVRLEELTRLSTKRDAQAFAHTAHVGRLQDVTTQKLIDFDDTATVRLSAVEDGDADAFEALTKQLTEERTALVHAIAANLAATQARCDEQLAAMLPNAITYDPEADAFVEQRIVTVWSPKTASELVDVAVEAGVFVRCTPDHVFITPNGDVEASALVGVHAWRKDGESAEEFVVTTVVPVTEPDPVAVFDMQVEGIPSYCVSPDGSSKSAVVHNSTYVETLKVERVFADAPPCEYETRELVDPASGESFDFTVPKTWSDQAATILATKYARKTGVPRDAKPWTLALSEGIQERVAIPPHSGETHARQLFSRLAGAWAYWGLKLGYFDEPNAEAFRDELEAMLAQQIAAPNSPQWFNTGLHWAYGITGTAQGHYAMETAHCKAVYACPDAFTRPQVHACFIQSVEDDLVGENGIMDLMTREARLFKFGSGTGTNYSKIRGKGESLAGGGSSSGLLSFLAVSDRSAGAIKSGGTTRRAARGVWLDIDHPDVEEFIGWKAREEEKIRALRAAGIGDASCFEDEASNTVSGQNGNNSIRVTDKFMRAVEDNDVFELTYRTTGQPSKVVLARDLWGKVCQAAWECADPGLQFHDTINAWHTCAADGEILGTNPCAEYHFVDETACNLASLNLVKFLKADESFDVDLYKHAARLWTIVLDISVSMAGYPSQRIAERSIEYRTLGLGYANLGGALMRLGIPYDSDEGRAWCSRATSRLGAYSWQTSAELAGLLGPFPAYARNASHVINVVKAHRDAPQHSAANWKDALQAVHTHGARNAQCTLLAPTGTIGLIMDCDTTGIEPVYALTSTKTLAGGGTMEIACPAADAYLASRDSPAHCDLAVETDPVLACANDIPWRGHLGMMAAAQPFLCGAISKTVNLPRTATVDDISAAYMWAWKHGLKAVAVYRDNSKATQVLTTSDGSSALDEYVNAVADNAAAEADRVNTRGLLHKVEYSVEGETARVSIWRNESLPGGAPVLARGERETPPTVRDGPTVKLSIAGESHYLTVNHYDDGRAAEIFVTAGKTGGAVQGMANAMAIAVSIGLQHGVPLDAYVSAFRFQRFAPAGFVADAPLDIRSATSPVDAYAQALDALQARPAATPPTEPAPVSETHSASKNVRVTRTGEVCSVCRSTNMRPSGSCFTCGDCGATTGCG